MKKIVVVKNTETEVKPFNIDDFMQDKEMYATIRKVSKKELKNLADELGLMYDDSNIAFSKKLLNAYLAKGKK